MSRSTRPVSEETARFHRVVERGDLEQLRTALKAGVEVDAPGHIGATALMLAVASKDLEKAKLLLRHGADPELADDFNSTALRHAVNADFEEGVRYLLSLGVDRGRHPKYPLKKIDYDLSALDVPMPEELRQVMSEAEWKESLEETTSEMDRTPTAEPIIRDVQSVAVLKLFLEAGDDLNLAPNEVKRDLLGLENGGEILATLDDYREHKSPLYGSRNPERMDFPFWREMIRTGGNAYTARQHFQDTDPFTKPGVVWCYDRFGASLTRLEDGRYVQIGGEHEDFYDPDFFIYNDVVIHDGQGGFEIHGYPKDVFPPTDFHTAALCGDGIYVVGGLGYPEQRQAGATPVYRLTLESWEMEAVATTGEMPGWIHGHTARYEPARNAIRIAGGELHVPAEDGELEIVPNPETFELDLTTYRWRRVK